MWLLWTAVVLLMRRDDFTQITAGVCVGENACVKKNKFRIFTFQNKCMDVFVFFECKYM